MSDYTETVALAAQLMAISALTAPKTKGQDYVRTLVLTGDDVKRLGEAIIAYGERTGKGNFDRDGKNTLQAEAVLLVGLVKAPGAGADCGACGFGTCKAFNATSRSTGEFTGPVCPVRVLDMGIALGSAVKTASMLNVDNRIMYKIGVGARDIGMVDWDFVMGIPLSVTCKNPFFDR